MLEKTEPQGLVDIWEEQKENLAALGSLWILEI